MIEFMKKHTGTPELVVEAACRNIPRFDEELQVCIYTTDLELRTHLHRPDGTDIIWQIEHEEINETAEETFPLQLEEFVQFSMN